MERIDAHHQRVLPQLPLPIETLCLKKYVGDAQGIASSGRRAASENGTRARVAGFNGLAQSRRSSRWRSN